ncbi:MAG: tetratricopeptide repeat protein [Candidatus Hydrogenedentes bacterium]|nr:tetratricopeptide repeat protein [Candidatus Hydrogenedentota bacterium]
MERGSGVSLRARALVLAAILAVTLSAYWPVYQNNFTNFDDPVYVTQNHHVLSGITWDGLLWAFTSATTGNWHPFTWLSHMLDVQCFGLRPWAHHGVSVAFHLMNTVLLYVFLGMATKSWGRSAAAAAVFALHPLHVESVAWISERKDVLSTFFFLLALIAYARYATTGRKGFYWATFTAFALGILSKPMLVTFPFVLLLIDVWPLARVDAGDEGVRIRWRTMLPLTIEKLPFLAVSVGFCALTFVVQARAESVRTFGEMSIGLRTANAIVAYTAYLGKTILPIRLAAYYPYPREGYPAWEVAFAAIVLTLLSAAALLAGRRRPWVPVGWFWYLGTLVPVIGLVQVGSQSMADRYMYIPMIGLLMAVLWTVPAPVFAPGWRRASTVVLGVVLCVALSVLTARQAAVWHNTFTLFEHALAVTSDNTTAHVNLGSAYLEAGDLTKAREHSEAALHLDSSQTNAYNNLGVIYLREGQAAKAVEALSAAVSTKPNNPATQYNLGLALKAVQQFDAAITHFAACVQLDPDHVDARSELASMLLLQGRALEAEAHYRALVNLRPERASAHINLGVACANQGRFQNAVTHLEEGLRLNPEQSEGRYYLAACYTELGRQEEAIRELERVLGSAPDFSPAKSLLNQLTLDPSEPK